MGQHKYNPTALAAKEGKLPKKPAKTSSRASERALTQAIYNLIAAPFIKANILNSYKLR